jgi:ferredoxin-NADP reductase
MHVTARQMTFDGVVLESIVETPDTKTLVIDVGPHSGYRAGQYVSIDPHQFPGLGSFIGYLEQTKGRREVPRAYSMCSAPSEPYVAITIKEEVFEPGRTAYPPLLSGYLVHQVRAGDRMVVTGFTGAYVLPDDIEQKTPHVLHLCAGSGSVPNFSMIKDSLQRHTRLRHTFLYSNKTWKDIIFRDALNDLAARHPDRLRVVHALTREQGELPPEVDVWRGRIDVEMLRAVLCQEPESFVFMCGPAITVWDRRACAAKGTTPSPQFLEGMQAHLAALEFPKARIKMEAYG